MRHRDTAGFDGAIAWCQCAAQAAEATSKVVTALAITMATNPALTHQLIVTIPKAHVKANKLTNTEDKVMWSVEFDETTCFQVGDAPAISAVVINDTAAYLVPA